MDKTDDLDDRLARLRARWPVGSMVDEVMARVGPGVPARPARRRRLVVGLAAGFLAAIGLAWLIGAERPKSLRAAVLDDLEKVGSAHLVVTAWDEQDVARPDEAIWYRRGSGVRVDGADRILVEDGTTQWSWPASPGADPPVVLRRRSPGFFLPGLLARLALPDIRGDWAQFRTPERDRVVGGRPCRGYTLAADDLEPRPPGARFADGMEHRAQILAEADGRIAILTMERRPEGGAWRPEREIRIDYDAPVPAEKVAARFPDGSRVVDCDVAFASLYPLERAIHRVELGGLILAVHDVRPLADREGFAVVSSVRGTPEFLKRYPPRRRPINPEVTVLDVASQMMTNRMLGGKYDIIGLGDASRDGVEFAWWAVIPRRFFQMKDGRREYQPDQGESWMPGEPGRLDDLPGRARVPLRATYRDEQHRDARGVQQEVSTWAVLPIPPGHPPATWEEVAAAARRDLLAMGVGGVGSLWGVSPETKPAGRAVRALSRFAPEAISDADLAAAVRRGLDDLRSLDETHDVNGP